MVPLEGMYFAPHFTCFFFNVCKENTSYVSIDFKGLDELEFYLNSGATL